MLPELSSANDVMDPGNTGGRDKFGRAVGKFGSTTAIGKAERGYLIRSKIRKEIRALQSFYCCPAICVASNYACAIADMVVFEDRRGVICERRVIREIQISSLELAPAVVRTGGADIDFLALILSNIRDIKSASLAVKAVTIRVS